MPRSQVVALTKSLLAASTVVAEFIMGGGMGFVSGDLLTVGRSGRGAGIFELEISGWPDLAKQSSELLRVPRLDQAAKFVRHHVLDETGIPCGEQPECPPPSVRRRDRGGTVLKRMELEERHVSGKRGREPVPYRTSLHIIAHHLRRALIVSILGEIDR